MFCGGDSSSTCVAIVLFFFLLGLAFFEGRPPVAFRSGGFIICEDVRFPLLITLDGPPVFFLLVLLFESLKKVRIELSGIESSSILMEGVVLWITFSVELKLS